MQYADWLQFGIGALLGLSAIPHCLVMCSGVATALSFAESESHSNLRREMALRSVMANFGRIFSYAIAGAAVGTLGVAAFSWLDASLANITLRWLAAVLLSIVGLSLAGIMPAIILNYPNRMLTGLLKSRGCALSGMRSYPSTFVAGAIWGFMPCAMAYSALFYATISGSPVRGFLTMTGFGFATLLPMILLGLGVSVLAGAATKPQMKIALGLALAAIGVAGTIDAAHDFGVWCRTP